MNSIYNNVTNADLLFSFENINEMLAALQTYSSDNFLPLSKNLKEYFKDLEGISIKDSKENRDLKKNYMGKIIIEIQFHDIIRQKLEHIEEIHMELVSEIKQKIRWNNLDTPRYMHILPLLIRLSIAQLEMINEEFKEALAILNSSLLKLSEIVTDGFIEKNNFTFLKTPDFLNTSNNIINSLAQVGQQIGILTVHNENAERYEYIESVYTMESERTVFYKVFNLPDSILEMEKSKTNTNDIDFF